MKQIGLWVLMVLVLSGCATVPTRARARHIGFTPEEGLASWYGADDKKVIEHGRLTASGEKFDMYEMTAAHKTLKLGTMVKVTNLENQRSVVVRINDRGPYIAGRIIDLSLKAARMLDMKEKGTARVRIEPAP